MAACRRVLVRLVLITLDMYQAGVASATAAVPAAARPDGDDPE